MLLNVLVRFCYNGSPTEVEVCVNILQYNLFVMLLELNSGIISEHCQRTMLRCC